MCVKERLKTFIKSEKISNKDFEIAINASNGYINSISKGIGLDKMELILEKFPNLNLEWLLLGRGEMTKARTNIVEEPSSIYTTAHEDLKNIPIIDIEAAAGIQGAVNPDYIEVLGYLTVPYNSLKQRTGVYYAIRNRGHSMSPTIYDKDYLIVRWLDRSEWQDLRDEYIYVVVADGNAYVKRIKDRLNRGFMVCMSDNLDKSNYPNFTLEANEIDNLFYTELKISPHLHNINATYYDRMKILEDKVDDLVAWRRSIK